MAIGKKFGIECQLCPHSMTMVQAVADYVPDETVETHLARVMIFHLENDKDPQHELWLTKNPSEEDRIKIVRTWVAKLKPRGTTELTVEAISARV